MSARPSSLAGSMCALALLLAGNPAPASTPAPEGERFSREELQPLLHALQGAAIGPERLAAVFYDPRLRRVEQAVTLNAFNPETAASYRRLRSPAAIRRAAAFRARFRTLLAGVSRRYGVPAEVIVAILLVETRFGTVPLPYRVLDVYTTLVLDAVPERIRYHFFRLRLDHPDLQYEELERRLKLKGAWAYLELVALLNMKELSDRHVLELRGSYAGAIGMAQFIPSSYLGWAVDGDGDSRVNLNQIPDAIASVANYLAAHGWTPAATWEEKVEAVRRYNKSEAYVATVLAVSRSLNPRAMAVARRGAPASRAAPVPAPAPAPTPAAGARVSSAS